MLQTIRRTLGQGCANWCDSRSHCNLPPKSLSLPGTPALIPVRPCAQPGCDPCAEPLYIVLFQRNIFAVVVLCFFFFLLRGFATRPSRKVTTSHFCFARNAIARAGFVRQVSHYRLDASQATEKMRYDQSHCAVHSPPRSLAFVWTPSCSAELSEKLLYPYTGPCRAPHQMADAICNIIPCRIPVQATLYFTKPTAL